MCSCGESRFENMVAVENESGYGLAAQMASAGARDARTRASHRSRSLQPIVVASGAALIASLAGAPFAFADNRLQGTQTHAQVDNLFDRRYCTFKLLGSNAFNGPNRSFGPAGGIAPVSEQFVAVGAPRTISVGLR